MFEHCPTGTRRAKRSQISPSGEKGDMPEMDNLAALISVTQQRVNRCYTEEEFYRETKHMWKLVYLLTFSSSLEAFCGTD